MVAAGPISARLTSAELYPMQPSRGMSIVHDWTSYISVYDRGYIECRVGCVEYRELG